MYLIEPKHIEHEAYQLHLEDNSRTPEQNWAIAVENLDIFPKRDFHLIHNTYNPAYDSFGMPMKKHKRVVANSYATEYLADDANVIWINCREIIEKMVYHALTRSTTEYIWGADTFIGDGNFFYYSTDTGNDETSLVIATKIAKFIRYLEVKRIDLTQLSKFEYCNRRLKITPSKFWFQSSMRFSLFTLLCRSGKSFNCELDSPNLEQCFLDGMKGRSTNTEPIFLFLAGHHNFTDTHDCLNTNKNWVDVFKAAGNGRTLLTT